MKKSEIVDSSDSSQIWRKEESKGRSMNICMYIHTPAPGAPEYTLQMSSLCGGMAFGVRIRAEKISDIPSKLLKRLADVSPYSARDRGGVEGFILLSQSLKEGFIPAVEAMVKVMDSFVPISEVSKVQIAKDFGLNIENIRNIYQPLSLTQQAANFITDKGSSYTKEKLETLPTDAYRFLRGSTQSMDSCIQQIIQERNAQAANGVSCRAALPPSKGEASESFGRKG